jgi:PiT family inorganic phosphate transporter
MDTLLLLTFVAVAIVLLFDYTNGFHDAANIVATVIASRAMQPAQAVLIVGVFEFLGPLLGGTAVANTIGKFVQLDDLPQGHVADGPGQRPGRGDRLESGDLVEGHSLVVFACPGGRPDRRGRPGRGCRITSPGVFTELAHGHVTGVMKVLLALILSPVIGFWVGLACIACSACLSRRPPRINAPLRWAQYLTAAGLAFSHGANDAQKSMGILTLALLLGGHIITFEVPFWVMLACATALTLGIMSGGWRIVRTLGFAIYKVRPMHALNSQLTSAGVIFTASLVGAPVSTTHVVATSIMGIGASEHPKAVRWGKAREIVTTWIITIPAAAFVAAVIYALIQAFIRRGQLL